MRAKIILTTLLGLAVFAVPAAVPASQPANVRLNDMGPAVAAAPANTNFAMLLSDPSRNGDDMRVEPVTGYTTLEWIDQDPFAL